MTHDSVSIRVLFFASARDRLGGKCEDQITLPRSRWTNYAELLDYLCGHVYPSINSIKSALALAVNEEYVLDGDIVLTSNDRVALIPPVTGG